MTRIEMAFQIFLKRMPFDPLTSKNRKGYISAAEQALDIADLFLKKEQMTHYPDVAAPEDEL